MDWLGSQRAIQQEGKKPVSMLQPTAAMRGMCHHPLWDTKLSTVDGIQFMSSLLENGA